MIMTDKLEKITEVEEKAEAETVEEVIDGNGSEDECRCESDCDYCEDECKCEEVIESTQQV
jgi:hypothetical protein